MIKLFLEGDYCQECHAFEADVEVDEIKKYDYVYESEVTVQKNFRIKCAYREQCRLIHDHVLRNMRGNEK